MTDAAALLPPLVGVVLVGIAIEWGLTRHRPRSGPLMAANLWIALFEQAMGLLVYIGLVAAYDRLHATSPLALSASSPGVWILGIVSVDLAFYAYHRFSHRTAIGWALHAVHHQSPELNATAAVRNSPVGGAVQFLFHVPLALLGLPTACWVCGKAVNTLWQLGLHTEAIGALPRLDGWLNTPSGHRVHHGAQPEYRDRNLGGVLLVWDRLFGTWAAEVDPPQYGTHPPLITVDPVAAQLAPLRDLIASVRGRGARALIGPPRDPIPTTPVPWLDGLDASRRGIAVAGCQLAAGVHLLSALATGDVPAWLGVPSLVVAGSLAGATSRGHRTALGVDAIRYGLTLVLAGGSP